MVSPSVHRTVHMLVVIGLSDAVIQCLAMKFVFTPNDQWHANKPDAPGDSLSSCGGHCGHNADILTNGSCCRTDHTQSRYTAGMGHSTTSGNCGNSRLPPRKLVQRAAITAIGLHHWQPIRQYTRHCVRDWPCTSRETWTDSLFPLTSFTSYCPSRFVH